MRSNRRIPRGGAEMGDSASHERSVVRGLVALERDRAKASALISSLKSGERSLESLTEEERKVLAGAPLMELVMARSWALRYDDLPKMIALAETARVLADNLSIRRYGRRVVSDSRARAWADLGNAYRVAQRLEEANEALRNATACALRGTGSPALMAHILYRWTPLMRDTRDLPAAAAVFEVLIPFYHRRGQQESLGKALLGLSLVHEHSNEPERATAVILEALRHISPDGPLLLPGINALAVNLAGTGDYESARYLLDRTRRLYRRAGKLNQYRLAWLEGKIAAGLGEFGAAEAKLNVARQAFKHKNLNYDSALVSLDLGLLYARLERRDELVWLVDDMVRTFRRLKIARELIASLLLLRKSCEKRFSVEVLCAQVETIAVTLAELVARGTGNAGRA
jgi:tetratricopeptide (TPR) repeat protein